MLFGPVVTYLQENYEKLPSDILDYEFFCENLTDQAKLIIIFKNGDLERLDPPNKIVQLEYLDGAIKNNYNTAMEFFTENEIKKIRNATNIMYGEWTGECDHGNMEECIKCIDILSVKTFVPFDYKYYIYVGTFKQTNDQLIFVPTYM